MKHFIAIIIFLIFIFSVFELLGFLVKKFFLIIKLGAILYFKLFIILSDIILKSLTTLILAASSIYFIHSFFEKYEVLKLI